MLKKTMIVMGFAGALLLAASSRTPYIAAGSEAHAEGIPLADAAACYTNCNQPCTQCEKKCSDAACRSACYSQADSCARVYGFTGHAHGGNTCNGTCEGAK